MPDATVTATTPNVDLVPGVAFGNYRILRALGRGGMGAVYAAERTGDGRVVALKILAHDLDSPESRKRFLREGKLAASLNHPNAVYVYGTEDIAGTPVIAMELVAGGTLEDRVKERGPLPVAEAVESALQVIDGLEAALGVGVLHRDVKPSNCFVALDGTVKVGDFGLSKPVEGGEKSRITQTGLFLGTPVYSSPEQLLNEPLDARSDIYAVGVTLYYMLTGALPFEADNVMQLVAAVLNGAPTNPRTHRPDLPNHLARVVLRAIARKPADRFRDYAEFRAALQRFRSRVSQPAPLGPRFLAGAVNDMVAGLAAAAASVTLPASLNFWTETTSFGAAVAMELLSLAFMMIVVAAPEGLWGTSPGKWLFGLAVVDRSSAPPGLPRSLLRAVVYWLPGGLLHTTVTHFAGIYDNWGTLLYPFFAGSLFITMRRRNGFAALQDLASDTRVVRATRPRPARHASARMAESRAPAGADGERIGAYRVTREVFDTGDGGSVMLGFDPELDRHVWIHLQSPGTPPVSERRREVARRTRLRWLAGRRTQTESWDAYEAPWGGPVRERAATPQPWEQVSVWLEDLIEELAAAGQDETLPRSLSTSHVWVNDGPNAVLLDFGAAAEAAQDFTPDECVREMADQLTKRQSVLPLHARAALDRLSMGAPLAEVISLLRESIGRPTRVSRRRRLGLLGVLAAPAILVYGLMLAMIALSAYRDPQGLVLDLALKYRSRSASSRDSSTISNRRLAEIYVASIYPAYSADSARRRASGILSHLSRRQRDTAAALVTRYSSSDPPTREAAIRLVESEWKNSPPGINRSFELMTMAWGVGMVVMVMSLIPVALLSCCLALIVRRGPVLRAMRLDFVTSTGARAGRARLFLRAVIAWLPLLLVLAGVVLIASAGDSAYGLGERIGRLAAQAGFWVTLLPLLWLAGVASALWNPQRSVADVIAGTHMVPT